MKLMCRWIGHDWQATDWKFPDDWERIQDLRGSIPGWAVIPIARECRRCGETRQRG